MKYPIVDYVQTSKEMTTNFQGYDNRLSCPEGSFYDELNVTADHYPILSTRNKRYKASNEEPYNTKYDATQEYYVTNQGWKTCTADRIFNTSDGNDLLSIKSPSVVRGQTTSYYPVSLTYGNKRVYTGTEADFYTENLNLKENPDRKVIRMGAKLCIFPDNMWINVDGDDVGEFGPIDDFIATAAQVLIELCNTDGEPISDKVHDEQYYKDNPTALVSGAYMITTTSNGTESLKVYSDLSKSWSTVTSTYISIRIRETYEVKKADLKEGDGVILRARLERHVKNSSTVETIEGLDKIFLTEDKEYSNRPSHELSRGLYHEAFNPDTSWYRDDDPYYSFTAPLHKVVRKKVSNVDYIYLVVPGIIHSTITIKEGWGLCAAREVPKMSHMTECQNRLWGCSEDGHEIYCCKLGDPTNWYYYAGTAADSYAATVGSVGQFTGAITYNQNPIFFKENSFLKVTVSSSGAHSYRSQDAEGVEKTSAKSIVNVEGVLYYLNSNGVYAFDGSSPQKVSDALGEHRYRAGISGKLKGKYYISVLENDDESITRQDSTCNHTLFVYDTYKGIWTKEADNSFIISDIYCTAETIYFTRLLMKDGKKNYETWCEGLAKYYQGDDESFFYGDDNLIVDTGVKENDFNWYCESAPIGYSIPGNKYIGRINVRMSLVVGAYVDFWMKYDNDTSWIHIFNMSGKGTKSFTIPVTPRRCDTFKYRLSGKGDCKIISITKTVEEGSDT